MMTLIREPLVHFFLLGGLVFAIFFAFDDSAPATPPDRIVIDAAMEARLAEQFEAVWRRAPSETELAALVEANIEEEILLREARLLALDRDDAVVRQRLVLKMRFLLEAGAAVQEPDDATLAAFLADNAERFRRAPLASFEQVPLDATGLSAEAALEALRGGTDPAALARSSLLPAGMQGMPPRAVDGTFGEGFFERVAALEVGVWQGPVTSGYGSHLVRLTALVPGSLPPLENIREAVLAEWRAAQAQALADERLDALRSRYDIRRAGPGEAGQ